MWRYRASAARRDVAPSGTKRAVARSVPRHPGGDRRHSEREQATAPAKLDPGGPDPGGNWSGPRCPRVGAPPSFAPAVRAAHASRRAAVRCGRGQGTQPRARSSTDHSCRANPRTRRIAGRAARGARSAAAPASAGLGGPGATRGAAPVAAGPARVGAARGRRQPLQPAGGDSRQGTAEAHRCPGRLAGRLAAGDPVDGAASVRGGDPHQPGRGAGVSWRARRSRLPHRRRPALGRRLQLATCARATASGALRAVAPRRPLSRRR